MAAGCGGGGQAAAPSDGLRPVAGYASYELCGSRCPGAVPPALHRPLHLPRLQTGANCPVSGSRSDPVGGLLTGPGPVSPVFADILPLARTSFAGSRWTGAKVLWVAAATYAGPVLIRGRQLDGPRAVGFGRGAVPLREMQLLRPGARSADEPTGYREWPSYPRVPGPGCYGYQVDGTSFSTTIVFRASPSA